MSNEGYIEAVADLARKNAQVAVDKAQSTREELLERIEFLEGKTATLDNQIQMLTQKMNLMIGARFDGKSTEVE